MVTVLHLVSARVILVSHSSLHSCSINLASFGFLQGWLLIDVRVTVSEMMAYLKVLSQLLSEVTEEQLQRADTGNLSNN
jgi:hypothetical protein